MTRLQGLGIACVLAGALVATGYAVLVSEEVAFLVPRGEAEWIGPPGPVDTGRRRVGPGHAQAAVFRFAFDSALDSALDGEAGSPRATPLEIELRALGVPTLHLDGVPVELSPAAASCLKRVCRASLPLLGRTHRLRVEVVNPSGPPRLWLAAAAGSLRIASQAAGWSVSPLREGAEPVAAVLADDTRPLAESLGIPTPVSALRRHAMPLCLALGLGFLLSAATQRHLRRAVAGSGEDGRGDGSRHLPVVALAIVALLWAYLFAVKFAELPLRAGFDVSGHLDYVRFLLDRGALPTAADGWSMYHPPAFYVAVAGLVALIDPVAGGVGERLVYRFLPACFGLLQAVVALGLGRVVFRGAPVAQALCVVAAGLLPVNLTLAAYFSNESGHAAAFAVALWLAVGAMESARLSRTRAVGLAAALGLALLAKFTALGLVPLVCFFLFFERWQARGEAAARAVRPAAAIALGALAIAGWYYARNVWLFGDPFVWNNDVIGGTGYWAIPGFHSLSYFTSFGAALSHPYFSAFASFWDGLYSTLWGDGMVAGFASFRSRPTVWNWSLMSVGYLAALPLTGYAVGGALACVRDSLRGPDLSRRCVLALLTTLLFALCFATVWNNLTVPYFGAARASYSLSLVAPFAVVLVRGVVGFDTGLGRLGEPLATLVRALHHAWLAVWAGLVILTYVA